MNQLYKLLLAILLISLSFSGNAQVKMLVKDDGILFMEGRDSVFFYQKKPKDKNEDNSRGNYIHPLYGIDNSRLTEDFPADHLHHRGIFWAWHQILIDNKQVSDGWELKGFQQKVTELEFRLKKGIGYMNTIVDWKSPKWKDGSEAYLQEKTTVTIYPKKGNYRRIDFEIKLKALVDRLSIAGSDDEKGYGGFSLRLKLPDDVSFWSENGQIQPDNNAINAGNTMKISGSFLKDKTKGGIVVISDLQNPNPSGSWILRKSASMQNVAYPGRQAVSIPFDEPLVLKYSLLVFQGDLSSKQIKNIYR